MRIVGLGGTNASGKDTVGEMLADRHGWQFVSVSDILRTELKKHGQDITRKNLRALSAKWRHQDGLGVLIYKAVKLYDDAKFKGLVISSLRNYGEAEEVHNLGGTVVWVDANPKVRYQRITSRLRSDEDKISYQEFIQHETEEMEHHQGDHHTLNLAGVKEKADIFLTNDGNDIEKFKQDAQAALGL